MMRTTAVITLLFLTIGAIAVPLGAQGPGGAPDNSSIPPDILRQMDPGLVAGKRPKLGIIKKDDIFGLRDSPRRDADFVTFDFNPAELSTAQRNILDAWARACHNKILLVGSDIPRYTQILGAAGEGYLELVGGDPGNAHLRNFVLAEHPVSTDCRDLVFGAGRYFKHKNGYPPWILPQAWVKGLDSGHANTLVVLKSDANKTLAGAFSIGRGTVYFRNEVGGPDSRRWLLNFYHWALDLRVPGAAETGATTGTGSAAASTMDDVIILKNQDKITGQVMNKSFTIKTSYATLTFERDKVDRVVLEGAGLNIDEMVLKAGDKLSGVLQDAKITMRLSSGADAELDRDKVKEIRILRAAAKDAGDGDKK